MVTGALTFEQQIGPVSVAFLALGAWFVLSAYIGAGLLPYGVGIGVLAALYVGYPLLAFRLGRTLLGRNGSMDKSGKRTDTDTSTTQQEETMARAGETIDNPVTGERFTWRQSGGRPDDDS